MAPMIDMVFLLLVFFMCVSSLSQAARLTPVDLPESTESKVPEVEGLANRATITVQADGSILTSGRATTAKDLEDDMRGALAANPKLRLHLRADRDVPFAKIREVLQACAAAGALDVIYATHEAGG